MSTTQTTATSVKAPLVDELARQTTSPSANVLGADAAANAAPHADSALGVADTLARSDAVFSWGGYFQAIGVLFLIIAVLFFALWYLKRKGGIRHLTGHGDLFLESRLALGPKKALFVVRFLNKRVLLGVTDQRITLLTELPTDEDDTGHNALEKQQPVDFTTLLAKASEKDADP